MSNTRYVWDTDGITDVSRPTRYRVLMRAGGYYLLIPMPVRPHVDVGYWVHVDDVYPSRLAALEHELERAEAWGDDTGKLKRAIAREKRKANKT